MIKYIGKCLLIEEEGNGGRKEREKKGMVLVIGDIHLGAVGEVGGVNLELERYKEMINELNIMFEKIGKMDKIVLLGDLKDEFSRLKQEERHSVVNLLDYLEDKCGELIILRGNHDNYLLDVISKRGLEMRSYYLLEEYCFLHGDRNFSDICKDEIKVWVMGHLHPAISLREGVKEERYKCFLEGEFKGKKVIILPSFISVREGIDVRWVEIEGSNLPWKFNLRKFRVWVVGENSEVLDFGILGKIRG